MTISRLRAWTVALVACAFMSTSACGGGGEARKAEHIAKGEKFMAERNYTKARIEFRNALQIDPKDAKVRALVGLSNERLEQYRDAVMAYRLALEADPTLEMPRARLALIYASAGLYDDAMELIVAGLEQQPKSSSFLTARAVAIAQKDLQAARRDAEEAVRIDPNNEDAVAVLASLMWRADEREQAIALLERWVSANPESIDLRSNFAQLLLAEGHVSVAEKQLVELEGLDPDHIDHSLRLVQAYLMQGKIDPAIDAMRAAASRHPENVDAKVALAQLLVEHRKFEEGESELLKFVRANEKDLDLKLGLGRFYEVNGRIDPARAVYQKIADVGDDRPQAQTARNRLAAISISQGRLDEAAGLVGSVLDRNPRDGEALAMRAELAMRRRDPAAATADLRAAVGDQPDSVPLAIALARAYVAAGQVELAEQALRAVVQVNPKDVQARLALAQFLIESDKGAQAQPVLEQLAKEEPNDPAALEGLARVQLAAGRNAQALQTAKSLQVLSPRSPRGFELAGAAYAADGKLQDAKGSYERAAELDPNSPEFISELVRLDLLDRQPERALARLDQADRKIAGSPLILAARGDALFSMGSHAEAILSYRSAVAALPNWAQVYRRLAGAYVAAGNPDQAMATLREGLEATGGSPELGRQLASMYLRSGRVDDAIAIYERRLEVRLDDDVAANNLAMILADHKGDARSLERATTLAERFATSENAAHLDTYGWVLFKLGRYQEAVEVLSRVSAKLPNVAGVRFHLGMAQVKAGQTAEGRQNLTTALELQKDFDGAELARAALADL